MYKKPLSPLTFILVGIGVIIVSLWVNDFHLSGQFTVFLFTGFLLVLYGFIKIPFQKKKPIKTKALACPYCKNLLKETDIFCPSCGRQLKPILKG